MVLKNDRDVLHFISEHSELEYLLNQLSESISQKTIQWRGDKKAAKLEVISRMHDKGLQDYDGIKNYLKNNLKMLEIKGDILKINKGTSGCCPYR